MHTAVPHRQVVAASEIGFDLYSDPGFLDLVEQVSPGPYLELFARRKRIGWDVWGDEVESDVEMAS